DDDSLKHLTHEEKDVILFFEETIDSLEDDFEEPALCDGGERCLSSLSLEENTSSPSEPEDVIDLVQPVPDAGEAEHLPDGTQAAEHPRLPRSVPTPLVVAQRMSETVAGNEALPPTSPAREGRPGERRTRDGERAPWRRRAAQPAPRAHRFPSNISVGNSSGKDFGRTISRAAVSVQERKAQVLANINGASFLAAAAGAADPSRRGEEADGPWAGAQPEPAAALANGFGGGRDRDHDAPRREPAPLPPAAKPVAFRPAPAPALRGKLARQSCYEPRGAERGPDARRRSGSLPRAGGFRPQGVTVRFSGRGSSEEARRDALRKLGLLKGSS
ncbi:proline and serine-rich protein 2, partial [Daubentonia madagascariensis]